MRRFFRVTVALVALCAGVQNAAADNTSDFVQAMLMKLSKNAPQEKCLERLAQRSSHKSAACIRVREHLSFGAF
jgi:hypothetical protein